MSISISIIVPVYNSDEFIEECLTSIISQDFGSFEVLVSDDLSSDCSRDILKAYESQANVRVFYQPKNLGITQNCNFLLGQSQGKYVCFFAGDDIMLPGKLKKQYEFMEDNPNCCFCYHPAEVFDSCSGKRILITDQKSKQLITDASSVIKEMGVSASMSIMARKSVLPSGYFNSELKYVSDWLIQIEMALKGDVGYIDEVLCKYRKYGDNNGKDISVYEDEFLSVLNHVSIKSPKLLKDCDKGKSRYLLGKSFRVSDSIERRSALRDSVKFNPGLVNSLIFLFTHIPFSSYAFSMIHKHRYLLKGLM